MLKFAADCIGPQDGANDDPCGGDDDDLCGDGGADLDGIDGAGCGNGDPCGDGADGGVDCSWFAGPEICIRRRQ